MRKIWANIIKIIIPSLLVGIIGALLGFWGGSSCGQSFDGSVYSSIRDITKLRGAVTGFLFCSFFSVIYFKIRAKRSLDSSVGLGLRFGATAGAFSGLVTGIMCSYAGSAWPPFPELLFVFFGAMLGVMSSCILLVFEIIVRTKLTSKKPVSNDN